MIFGGKKKKTEGNESSRGKSKNVSKKSKMRKIKPKTQRPVARTISLILALLMLLGFVIPSSMSVWNMFFGAKLSDIDFNDEKTQKLLQELAELSKKHQNKGAGSVEEDASGHGDESSAEGEHEEGDVSDSDESAEDDTDNGSKSDESDEE